MGKIIQFLRGRSSARSAEGSRPGFMTRLAKDVRANTLVIMGLSLIPLAGMVGGGIDISRMYILKTRLQHACDAGALAGRKAMGGGTWSQTVNGTANYPQVKAVEFFDGNFQNGSYGSYNRTRTFTENAGKVTGSASATIPMTLMKVFQRPDETLTVACTADMRLPNTDVMFVLDTTGSMGETPSGDSMTKMASLKIAVKCFYEIVARLDSNANCTTGAPSGGTGNQVQIRFGFVPYAVNVNVGRLLKNEWMADNWTYQSRVANFTPPGTYSSGAYWQGFSGGSISQADCLRYMNNIAFSGFTPTPTNTGTPPSATTTTTFNSDGNASSGGNGEWGWNGSPDTDGDNRSCRRRRTDVTTTYVPTFANWTYRPVSFNVSSLKAGGSAWNNGITAPIAAGGEDRAIAWEGCIEERETIRANDYDPIPSGAKDLDIDLLPTTGDPTTQWGPALPDLIYGRNITTDWNQARKPEVTTAEGFYNSLPYSCSTEAKKLQSWPMASAFDNYVDSLQPSGNTYHDIGLIWGGRLLSPTGPFAAENAFTPQGGEIERHLIFMTDGDPCTSKWNYGPYGVAWWDRRQTDDGVEPTDGCTTNGTLTQQVNLRTEALCSSIKNKNITLWVITFGSLAGSTNTRMSSCATPGRYFNATNAETIQQTFKQIADQISSLRLTS